MPDFVQHALLKSIEEPPAHAVVMLVTALPHRLLPTVRSRCAHVHIAPLAAGRGRQRVGLGGPAGLRSRARAAAI